MISFAGCSAELWEYGEREEEQSCLNIYGLCSVGISNRKVKDSAVNDGYDS